MKCAGLFESIEQSAVQQEDFEVRIDGWNSDGYSSLVVQCDASQEVSHLLVYLFFFVY